MHPQALLLLCIAFFLLRCRARWYGDLWGVDDPGLFTILKVVLGCVLALWLVNKIWLDRVSRRSFRFVFLAVILVSIRTWDYCDLFGIRDPSFFIISKFILGFVAMSVFAYEKWKESDRSNY